MKRFAAVLILLISSLWSGFAPLNSAYVSSDFVSDLINSKKLRMLPVSKDFRNYFILQSINDQTNVIVGDFVGSERKIVLLEDYNSDNTIDKTYEYYPDRPDSNRLIPLSKSTSDLCYDILQMKKDIISGAIFTKNYTYTMRSMNELVYKLKKGEDIFKYEHGYTVKIYDPDSRSTIMSDFFFGRKDGRYFLQFKTEYYKLFNNKIKPLVPQSVYCVNSKDAVVKEAVEKLINLKEN